MDRRPSPPKGANMSWGQVSLGVCVWEGRRSCIIRGQSEINTESVLGSGCKLGVRIRN